MGVLLVALLLLPQGRLATAKFGGKTRRLVGLRSSLLLAAAFVAGTWVVSGMLSGGNLIIFGKGMVLGVVMLSLVLLTGYGGQVSLAQMTFAGLGAYCMGNLLGGDSLLGLGAAIVLPAVVGAVLALVVLRLRGLYLALATLAFAYAMDNMFFNKELGVGGILKVGRFAVDSQRGFLLEVAVLFAICAVGVLAIKRGGFGRRLAALNDSEVACASLGMNITTTKVVAFTLAAGIAGLGGALLGGWQHQISPNDVPALFSLIVLLLLAVGGLGTVAGAFAAAMAYALQPTLQAHAPLGISNFPQLLVGVGAVSLGRNPAGIAGYASDAAEWVRARLAGREQAVRQGDLEGAGAEEVGVVRVAG